MFALTTSALNLSLAAILASGAQAVPVATVSVGQAQAEAATIQIEEVSQIKAPLDLDYSFLTPKTIRVNSEAPTERSVPATIQEQILPPITDGGVYIGPSDTEREFAPAFDKRDDRNKPASVDFGAGLKRRF